MAPCGMKSVSMSSGRHDVTRLLQAAFEIGQDAVLVFDRERTVVHANALARRLFADDIVGLPPARRAERWTFRDAAGRLMPAETSPSASDSGAKRCTTCAASLSPATASAAR